MSNASPRAAWPGAHALRALPRSPSQAYKDPTFIGADRGSETLGAGWNPAGPRRSDRKPSPSVKSVATGSDASRVPGSLELVEMGSGSPQRSWGACGHSSLGLGSVCYPPSFLRKEQTRQRGEWEEREGNPGRLQTAEPRGRAHGPRHPPNTRSTHHVSEQTNPQIAPRLPASRGR